ncbi:conserved exported hypothetical protein [Desulfamplus magnetovallimortis]|uniref:Uncharacterized protein n=1 Tax=Desulfamplus magnetovallimortis TaxID=1246637 RepID=A0A1W1HFV5_9BACT|nr:hypothetical protein [Desulfamplus magnetovallimortis]SLM31367.1 conserved exported hypothetical protein [Desulfamplus magnetovallimortis]
MKANQCVRQKLSKSMLSLLIFLGAVGLIITGFTLLPIVGFILAIPVTALSYYVYKLHLNEQCEIEPI